MTAYRGPQGDVVGRAAQRHAPAGGLVVWKGGRDVAQRRLGLDLDEVNEVLDGECRRCGVGDLPDDDRCDLDRVAFRVVDLEVVCLEVAYSDTQAPAVHERHGRPEPRTASGSDVRPEEAKDLSLAGLDDHQRARHKHSHHDRPDQADGRATGERDAGGNAAGDHQYAEPGPLMAHTCRSLILT